MGYVALKRFPVGNSHSVPGQVCKDVENWKDPKKWENWGYIIKEELFDPAVHLKGGAAQESALSKAKGLGSPEPAPLPAEDSKAKKAAKKKAGSKKPKPSTE